MKQLLLCLFLALTALSGIQAATLPELPTTPGEALSTEETRIALNGKELRVLNAEGKTMDIYNIAGLKVASYRVDSADKTILLHLEKGIYIVKVGKIARRINIG